MTLGGYLRAVAAGLEDAGLPVADWRADPGEGWIPFDRRRPSIVAWEHDQAGLTWSESDGWALLLVNSPGRRRTVPLAVPLLAAPASIALAVATWAGVPLPPNRPTPNPDAVPDFDGPAGTQQFARALARYA